MRIPFSFARICLMLLMLCATSAMAQNMANFTIGNTGNFHLKMTFNGKNYSLLDKTVSFQNVQPGVYPIALYQVQRKADGTYDYVKVYEGTTNLKAGMHMEVMVLRFGKVVWDEGPYTADSWTNAFLSPVPTTGGSLQTTGNAPVMADDAFQSLLSLLRKAGGDYNRRDLCPGLFKNNLFTARQIASICAEFSDDYYRIDVSKTAYPYCYDKGSYFVVADVFKNDYYRKSLLEFIASQK
jgi:hypothetical protein